MVCRKMHANRGCKILTESTHFCRGGIEKELLWVIAPAPRENRGKAGRPSETEGRGELETVQETRLAFAPPGTVMPGQRTVWTTEETTLPPESAYHILDRDWPESTIYERRWTHPEGRTWSTDHSGRLTVPLIHRPLRVQ